MDQILQKRFSRKKVSVILAIIMIITSFGIALGRFLRFNSWDMIAQPKILFGTIFTIFSYPSLYTHVYLLTIVFFLFLFFSYYGWKSEKQLR